ncbi:MAG: TetR/AcrR family transcriptional regulator [Myxococcales bacterium]
MTDPISKKEQTRARILAGAGRAFRSHGYGGSGVDGLAKEAGVTSGAFYSYFKSKADAFREAVQTGMQDLARGIRGLRASAGDQWVPAFVDFYLTERRTCSLTESCALQSLTGEVARADEATREVFEAELHAVVAAAADGLEGSAKARRHQALVMLALLSGGVSLARAVNDPAFSEEIAAAIRGALAKPSSAAKPPAARSAKKRHDR